MREFRQPLPIPLDTADWSYPPGHPRGIQNERPKAFDEVMDLLVKNGNFIRGAGYSFDYRYDIKVVGRDGYAKSYSGDQPSKIVRKALEEYERHLKDQADTAKMLEEYRQGTLNIPAVAKAC